MSFGEAGRAPDPRGAYALKMATVNKHIEVENQYLQALRELWPEYRDHVKQTYTPFQQKLEAIQYGQGVENIENKRILVGGQGMLFGPAEELLVFSQEATEDVGQWLTQKQALEKQSL